VRAGGALGATPCRSGQVAERRWCGDHAAASECGDTAWCNFNNRKRTTMNNIFWLIGVVVVIALILGFLGFG
jgi:hypothetical protein